MKAIVSVAAMLTTNLAAAWSINGHLIGKSSEVFEAFVT